MSENLAQNDQKSWLFVALIYADFNQAGSTPANDITIGLDSLFTDILSTPICPDQCRLFVILESITQFESDAGIFTRNAVTRYEIGKSATNIYNDIIECKLLVETIEKSGHIAGSGETSSNGHILQHATSLARILATIPVGENEQIFFTTWDHGAGFGIFSEENLASAARLFKPPEVLFAAHPALTCFWQRGLEATPSIAIFTEGVQPAPPELLTNADLAAALNAWVTGAGKKYVDVLLMMNCWMLNVHTMYAMKDSVSYLVAPQTDIGNPGYNYSQILSLINRREPQCTPRDLAIRCVTSRYSNEFRQKVDRLQLTEQDVVDSCVVLAMDLQATDKDGNSSLANHFAALKKFAGSVLEMLACPDCAEAVRYMIRYSRAISYDFTLDAVHFIDINNFISQMGQMGGTLYYPAELSKLESACQSYAVSGGPGNVLAPESLANKTFTTGLETKYLKPRPTGYSMFFRRGGVGTLKPNEKYILQKDKLLVEYMPEWNEIFTIVFGA